MRGDCISWYLFDHLFRVRRLIQREYPTTPRTLILAKYTQDKWRKWIGDSLRLDIPWESVASVSFLSEVCAGVWFLQRFLFGRRAAVRSDNLWIIIRYVSIEMNGLTTVLLRVMINTFYFNRLATCKSITCYCNFSYCVDILTTHSATVELIGHFTR